MDGLPQIDLDKKWLAEFIASILADYYKDVVLPSTNIVILGVEKAIFTVMLKIAGQPVEFQKEVLNECIKALEIEITKLSAKEDKKHEKKYRHKVK